MGRDNRFWTTIQSSITLFSWYSAFIGKALPGIFEWLEKLVVIWSFISLIVEYFAIGILHWRKTNQKKKIKYFLRTVCIFSLVFLLILNCVQIGWSSLVHFSLINVRFGSTWFTYII